MKSVSVIGPDRSAVDAVAAGIRRCRVLPGAGPGEGVDGVVAVVPALEGEDLEVVRAVRDSMGVCVVVTDAPDADDAARGSSSAGAGAGIVVVPPGRPDELQDVVDGLWVDRARWLAEARRRDAERLERVRIAVRLAAQRAAAELHGLPAGPAADDAFRARLRLAVLEQGAEAPPMGWSDVADVPSAGDAGDDRTPAGTPAGTPAVARSAGAAAAVLAAGAVLARAGAPGWLAAVLAVAGCAAVAWARVRAVRAERRRRREEVERGLRRERWDAEVSDCVRRIRLPSVAAEVEALSPRR